MARSRKKSQTPLVKDEVRLVGELRPDPRNARRHTTAQISEIAASIGCWPK